MRLEGSDFVLLHAVHEQSPDTSISCRVIQGSAAEDLKFITATTVWLQQLITQQIAGL